VSSLLVRCHYIHSCHLQTEHCKCAVCWFCVIRSTAAFHRLSTVCQCTVCWFCVTMSSAAFYSLSTLWQYFTLYSLLFLCHHVHCYLLQSVHCLSLPHTVQSVVSVSLCPLLSSRVCLYLTQYILLVLCYYVHCCMHSLSVPHTVQPVGSVTLCTLMSSTESPRSVYSLSTDCQYLTLYSLLVLCHYVHYCLLQSVQSLSVFHIVHSVGFVSLCPLLPCTVYPFSQYLTLYSLLFLCHYVHRCLLHSVHCLSVTHNIVCWFCVTMSTAVFYVLSTVCQYLTVYSLLVLSHYVQYSLLQSVQCLKVPHTAQSVRSVSLCPLLNSNVCPLSVSTSHCTFCWIFITLSTAEF